MCKAVAALDSRLCVLQKKSQEGINTRLALVMKSGKFTLGTKTCLKCLRSGKGKLCCFRHFCLGYSGRGVYTDILLIALEVTYK